MGIWFDVIFLFYLTKYKQVDIGGLILESVYAEEGKLRRLKADQHKASLCLHFSSDTTQFIFLNNSITPRI